MDMVQSPPNKSPGPTPDGAGGSAIAVHVASRRWPGFFRQAANDTMKKHATKRGLLAFAIASILLSVFAFRSVAESEIQYATRIGDLTKVKALLKKNPDLIFSKGVTSEDTPLHSAAANDHKDIVDYLLANKADVSAKNILGQTPLFGASEYGNKDVVEVLLANKADANARDINGETPLHWARTKEVAALLLTNNADLNARNNRGKTPLHRAAETGFKDVVEFLLANKADVNSRDNLGETALAFAAMRGHQDIVELLVANKAEINAKDKAGYTPLRWAVLQQHKEVADFLRQHGGQN
jgi:ankyrin repeat protein